MKINTDIFLLGTSIKENKQKEQYVILSVADLQKGSIIEVNVKVISVGEIMGYSAELQNWE